MALQVACDTAVNGCVFMMRTETHDKDRLLRVTQEHLKEQHGKDFSREEIEEIYLRMIDVPELDA